MANYNLDAMLELRKFIWDDLVNLEIFDENEYYIDTMGMSIIPIVPTQQIAEIDQFLSGKKHIVYDKIATLGNMFRANPIYHIFSRI